MTSTRKPLNGVTAEATGAEVMTILSYGLTDTTDLVLSLPYQWGRVKEGGLTVYDEKGISDTTLEVKWRFFEKDGLMLALKPGLIFPTGNEEKGLGAGKVGYQAFLIGTKEADPWEFHANVGYIGNENKVDQEKNIWHASLAAEYELFKDLELVANIGIERNRYKDGKRASRLSSGRRRIRSGREFLARFRREIRADRRRNRLVAAGGYGVPVLIPQFLRGR